MIHLEIDVPVTLFNIKVSQAGLTYILKISMLTNFRRIQCYYIATLGKEYICKYHIIQILKRFY